MGGGTRRVWLFVGRLREGGGSLRDFSRQADGVYKERGTRQGWIDNPIVTVTVAPHTHP